jgi:hypothetical protein
MYNPGAIVGSTAAPVPVASSDLAAALTFSGGPAAPDFFAPLALAPAETMANSLLPVNGEPVTPASVQAYLDSLNKQATTGNSAPTGPNVTTGKVLTAEQWLALITNNPVYKYKLERLQEKDRLDREALRLSYSSGGGYTPDYSRQRAILAQQVANQKAELQRQSGEAAKLTRERLGGGRSGTTAVTLESDRAKLESVLRDIDLSAAMQNAQWDEAQRAAASSSGSSAARLQNALAQQDFAMQDAQYSLLVGTGQTIINYYWNGQGQYIGPNGDQMSGLTLGQAQQGLAGAAALWTTQQPQPATTG